MQVSKPREFDEALQVIERHVDAVHRDVLRSTTDPAKGLPRFKTKAQQAQDERILRVLLTLLAEVHPSGASIDQLQQASYERVDGKLLTAEDTRLRRRLQGIPEVAPQLAPATRAATDSAPHK